MRLCANALVEVGVRNHTRVFKISFRLSASFANTVSLEEFDRAPVPIRFGKAGMAPGSAEVPNNCINLRQFHVRCGEGGVQANCFEQ